MKCEGGKFECVEIATCCILVGLIYAREKLRKKTAKVQVAES